MDEPFNFFVLYLMSRDCSLNYPKNTSSEHVVYKYCFECQNKNKTTIYVHNMFWPFSFHTRTGKSMNNIFSYCGLVVARISASEKYLPVSSLSFCSNLIREGYNHCNSNIETRFKSLYARRDCASFRIEFQSYVRCPIFDSILLLNCET